MQSDPTVGERRAAAEQPQFARAKHQGRQHQRQEKIEYAPALEAADGGGVKVEIRMMFLRPDAETKPKLAQNLVRLSRGKMLGVDFNKDFTWVGSSVAFSATS